jgi:hypothetical protein
VNSPKKFGFKRMNTKYAPKTNINNELYAMLTLPIKSLLFLDPNMTSKAKDMVIKYPLNIKPIKAYSPTAL